MSHPFYQVDAFTHQIFGGNPAAVVPLDAWLPDAVMQSLASENNLAETAFFIPTGEQDCWHLRWFTPAKEVKLCGHATLATAYIVFNCLKNNHTDRISFHTLSGWLHVTRSGNMLTLDFPADRPEVASLPTEVLNGFNIQPVQVLKGKEDYVLVYREAAEVLALHPDFKVIAQASARGFIATAPGAGDNDFVSRCFFPAYGIDEDPVTGSAHTTMVPYWAERLGKNTLSAIQVSARRGYLSCTLEGDRVLMSGQGRLYMEGKFYLD